MKDLVSKELYSELSQQFNDFQIERMIENAFILNAENEDKDEEIKFASMSNQKIYNEISRNSIIIGGDKE